MTPPKSFIRGPAPLVERLHLPVLFFVGVGGAAYLAVAIWAGWQDVTAALSSLGWALAVLGLGASTLNYLLRFLRWIVICRALTISVPWRWNLKIYLAGLALTASPGKIGETVRSAFLLPFGVPVATSLAAFFVDRLADVVGVLLLAALTASADTRWAYGLLALLALGAGFVMARSGTALGKWTSHLSQSHPRLHGIFTWLRTASVRVGDAWRMRRILLFVVIAMIAYGLQGAVFARYVTSMWPAIDPTTAFHFFLISTLAGAASTLPGGLGAMEASLIALLVREGMPLALATSATIGIRLVTLWFGILIGVCFLGTLRRLDTQRFEANNTT